MSDLVFTAEVWNCCVNKYIPLKTKSGNSLHRTKKQAKKKLESKDTNNTTVKHKGLIKTYKLILIEEEKVNETKI